VTGRKRECACSVGNQVTGANGFHANQSEDYDDNAPRLEFAGLHPAGVFHRARSVEPRFSVNEAISWVSDRK
jgi:hypothetical protein